MDFLSNEYIVENLSKILAAGVLAFAISFLVTPLVAKFARRIGAIDLPAHMRRRNERSNKTRIHDKPIPRLAGLSMLIAMTVGIILTDASQALNVGIIIGLILISIAGFLDDKYDIGSATQLTFMVLAALSVIVIGGISVTSINFLGINLDFDWFSTIISIGDFTYNLIFPADLLTLIWIVAIINFVNWMSGVDGVNGTLSAIAGFAMLMLALESSNIPLALLISLFIGANLGWLPYNYSPAKILPGMAELINGYLLAVFAILSGTRWTVMILLLGIPILDALLVLALRFKSHPEVRKKPWKVLQIGDTRHLHHRLLSAGYSKKMVLLIEATMMSVLAGITIFFGYDDSRPNFAAFIVGITFIIIAFTTVSFLQARRKRNLKEIAKAKEEEMKKPQKQAEVKVIVDDKKEDDYERYIY